MKRQGIIVGLAGVAVVGIVVAHYAGIIPPKSGLEGTIGAAKRYQATQITDRDVVLQDPQVQALLQSDLFHKVIATPEFKKVAQNEQFWRLVTTADFQRTIAPPNPSSEFGKTIAPPNPSSEFGKTIAPPAPRSLS